MLDYRLGTLPPQWPSPRGPKAVPHQKGPGLGNGRRDPRLLPPARSAGAPLGSDRVVSLHAYR